MQSVQFVEVSTATIELSNLVGFVSCSQHGAQAFFIGAVRDFNHGKKVIAVSYDAFEPLAVSILHKICNEARESIAGDLRIAVVHRVGRLGVGDASVAIVASTRHRDEAFACCRYVIEELKKRAPIWKKEHYESGETEWLKGHALCEHKGQWSHFTRSGACGRPLDANENR